MQRFTATQPDDVVTAEQLTKWLGEVCTEHAHMRSMDCAEVALSLQAQGFTTVHNIAVIDQGDLESVAVPRAYAKVLVRYLGCRAAPQRQAGGLTSPGPTAMPTSSISVVEMAQAFAGALEGNKDVPRLTQSDPTVHAAREWALKHVERASKVMIILAPAIQELRSRFDRDLDALLANPDMHAADAAYATAVLKSLHEDHRAEWQIKGTVAASALRTIAAVMKGAIEVRIDAYLARRTKLYSMGETRSEDMMRPRLDAFRKRLTKVRCYSMFQPQEAVKGLVGICSMNAYLVNELMTMWNASTKTQQDLSTLLVHATVD